MDRLRTDKSWKIAGYHDDHIPVSRTRPNPDRIRSGGAPKTLPRVVCVDEPHELTHYGTKDDLPLCAPLRLCLTESVLNGRAVTCKACRDLLMHVYQHATEDLS